MNYRIEIEKVHAQLKNEMSRYERQKRKLEKRLSFLYEDALKIKRGDRVKVSSLTIRDIHRESDIRILGKEGTVHSVNGGITVRLDEGGVFFLSSANLKKLDKA